MLKLEGRSLEHQIELSPQQVTWIEKANPYFRERINESSLPGEVLSQDTFYVGVLKGVGRVCLHVVMDTYGSSGSPQWRSSLLSGKRASGRCDLDWQRGKDTHPNELYLELNDLEHRKTQVCGPQANGFVERFDRTVLDEFFRIAFRTKLYELVEALQADLDTWLVHYNTGRPDHSFRNQGRRPIDTLSCFQLKVLGMSPKNTINLAWMISI